MFLKRGSGSINLGFVFFMFAVGTKKVSGELGSSGEAWEGFEAGSTTVSHATLFSQSSSSNGLYTFASNFPIEISTKFQKALYLFQDFHPMD